MEELTERLTDIGNQAQEAQRFLCEAAAVMAASYQAETQSQYITAKERTERHLFLSIRLAQIEECHNRILENIKAVAFAEMVRIFNEHTHGALKEQAPQIVKELTERMQCEGRI